MLVTALLGATALGLSLNKSTIPAPQFNPQRNDPRAVGATYASSKTSNKSLVGLNMQMRPIQRPISDLEKKVLLRRAITPEAASRMQHINAMTLPEAPIFTRWKDLSYNRQIAYNRLPPYHPGYSKIVTTHCAGESAMPTNDFRKR